VVSYQDRTLTCVECKSTFLFSADDQRYHAEKGYTEPKRCPACRVNRRQQRGSGGGDFGGGGGGFGGASQGPRRMYPATCGECGQPTEVPFLPRGDRPVYCNNCFQKRRRTTGGGMGGDRGGRNW
jgi:CxxC-x17-CxxC domain-containing protein